MTESNSSLIVGMTNPTRSSNGRSFSSSIDDAISGNGPRKLPSLYQRRDGIWRPLAALLLAPLGLFGYVAWVGWRMGEWTGYFTLQRGAWLHFFDYGKHTASVLRGVAFGHNDYFFAYPTEDLIAGRGDAPRR